MEKQDFMRHAIALAKNGIGAVDPNPLVGAVIVKDGEIIGEGWHARFGGLHAERNALANCRTSPKGATIYVTLEPCCGKQAWKWKKISSGRNVTPSTVLSFTTSPQSVLMWQ